MRRRRSMRFSTRSRRSSPAQGRPSWIIFGLAAVALIAGFVYLVRVGDELEPPRQEIRVAVPDAFDRSK